METTSALRRNEQRLELALNAGRLGTWEFDLQTRRLTASAQCKANHGLRPEQDLQLETDVVPAIDPDHPERFRSALIEAIERRGSFDLELPHRWPDGTRHWLLIAGRVIDPTCMVGVTQDITDRRRAEEAVRQADRQKDEFLAVLGHELRGPLAAILTAARLLQIKGPPDPTLQKLRDTILRQGVQVSKLVDDLLDVGRITSGKLRLDKARVDVNTIVKQAVETCAPLIERRQHTLTVSLSEAPILVDADAARIIQIVSNLLNNAAKYMQEGGRLELTTQEASGTAVIRVKDEGVGIAPEMLDRIFQRFVQVGSSQEQSEGGLGLGLSLVKALVELHDGSVDAHSDGIGKGSEFTVCLPLIPATVSSI